MEVVLVVMLSKLVEDSIGGNRSSTSCNVEQDSIGGNGSSNVEQDCIGGNGSSTSSNAR